MSNDPRLFSPSAARNRGPILEVLRAVLPASGLVLEVASGSGEHLVHFAQGLPELTWQPSEVSPEERASIDAWAAGVGNVLPACALDAAAATWPVRRADAVLCTNMIHIAPWAAAAGLVAGAGRVLPAGGVLVLYGPFRLAGRVLAAGNAAFDADLWARDPAWAVRAVEDLAGLARVAGLGAAEVVAMPADNAVVVFRRRA